MIGRQDEGVRWSFGLWEDKKLRKEYCGGKSAVRGAVEAAES
jgi:hypothetical protein